MLTFLKTTVKFVLIGIFLCEILFRIFIDGIYFNAVDTYNRKLYSKTSWERLNPFKNNKTKHVDFLFIGSSRVPAAINPKIFEKKEEGKVAVVAGRGSSTAGIHYQALKKRVDKYPNYLDGATVFIEYTGNRIYDSPFEFDKYRVFEPTEIHPNMMGHLILPHLSWSELDDFWAQSTNSFWVKLDVVFSYISAMYRSVRFVSEKFSKTDQILKSKHEKLFAEAGGIRNDNFELVIERATKGTIKKSKIMESEPLLSSESLDKSSLAAIANLIRANGGELVLFDVPLHSFRKQIYITPKELKNKEIFEKWLARRQIEIIKVDSFSYSDNDFPDIMHLRLSKQDEFTKHLYNAFKKQYRN